MNEDAGQERAWLRQDPTLEQEWLRAPSLDLSARICVVASAQVVAQICAFVGVVAAFWHILWIAGWGYWQVGSWGLHLAGYWRLERDQAPPPQEEPDDTES